MSRTFHLVWFPKSGMLQEKEKKKKKYIKIKLVPIFFFFFELLARFRISNLVYIPSYLRFRLRLKYLKVRPWEGTVQLALAHGFISAFVRLNCHHITVLSHNDPPVFFITMLICHTPGFL